MNLVKLDQIAFILCLLIVVEAQQRTQARLQDSTVENRHVNGKRALVVLLSYIEFEEKRDSDGNVNTRKVDQLRHERYLYC